MRLNYANVIQKANELKEEGQQIKRTISMLNEILSDMRTDWKSPAGNEMFNKGTEFKQELTQIYQEVNDLSETLRYVADRVRAEDEELERRARMEQEAVQREKDKQNLFKQNKLKKG